MRPHRFDPISAVLAAIAIVLGVLVALDRIDPLDHGIGWWIAIAGLVFGLALIPWDRRDVR